MSDLQDSMWLVGDANGGHIEYDEKRAQEAASEGWTVIGLVTTHGAQKHLAAEKAKWQAEALREAAGGVYASGWWADGSDNYASKVRGWLHDRADRIAREKGSDDEC